MHYPHRYDTSQSPAESHVRALMNEDTLPVLTSITVLDSLAVCLISRFLNVSSVQQL